MKLRKIGISLFFFLFSLNVFSYEVDLPQPTQNIQSSVNVVLAKEDKPYYMELSEIVNKYLWFFTGFVSFILVLTAGYYLLTSKGNSQDLKKANKMLIWGLVGIFVSLLAYVFVKVLINLF